MSKVYEFWALSLDENWTQSHLAWPGCKMTGQCFIGLVWC
jgi:hypothetical protein